VVKAILCEQVDPHRIAYRDAKSYFSVLLDDNNRKPLCRLYFTEKSKSVALIGPEKTDQWTKISGPQDLYLYARQLRETLARYESAKEKQPSTQ
jgi:hypothetical protein